MKGERIMIPKSLTKNMLIKLHGSHMGIEKTRRLARETMFWPGINGEIGDYVANCSTCLEYRHSNQKEPLIPHTISELSWQKVATDLFQWKGSNYLVIVDYQSRYFEYSKLENMKSTTVINHIKSIFPRHGSPLEVMSDNAMYYKSAEFVKFSQQWGFKPTNFKPEICKFKWNDRVHCKNDKKNF